ncbi:hypothetical protein N7462_001777 [Penicillium macrosclerotiorum]|uniref:uncharacterized protein n=1 Tax=Penicillium macrosclerotiorum TaxID=303699 RepID=UPI002546A7C5|nr:uncharacterized protein N7462_001777 [Penicillium macrosclerotiorum]KAJ5692354.1 hypothetical protein N7462_001777 [Penicillium macrosclerotiorum]
MATEDDNFDIDIYGDGGGYNANDQGDYKQDDGELVLDTPEPAPQATANQPPSDPKPQSEPAPSANGDHPMPPQQQPQTSAPDAPAPIHGVKRKEYDDRQSDPDATTALLISDLFWWTTDDDIRGWVNQAQCEDELKDVTFSEHKVNGKSKGQVFVEFTTPQAATAAKREIENSGAAGTTGRKHMVNYTNPHTNPFRTLPKDAPMRKDANRTSGFNSSGNQNMNFGGGSGGGGGGMNMTGGFRGGRGGFNNRGMGGNMGNFNNRNNFNNMGGFQGGAAPGGAMMGGFQGGPMGGMQNYGFNNRGGMMGGMRGGPGGMRGGRGGGNMGGSNMMGMPGMNPMGGMGMNPMAGGMNPMMGGMGGNMGQGFQGPNPGFNQNFFNANQGGGGDGSWNPHGAKRSRQE